jgi:hypothetical protein
VFIFILVKQTACGQTLGHFFKAIVGVPQLDSCTQAARVVFLHPNNYKHEAHLMSLPVRLI